MDAGSYLVKVLVNGQLIPTYQYSNGVQSAQLKVVIHLSDVYFKTINFKLFTCWKVTSANTPSITRISPISGVPGTFVTISGDFKTSCLSRDVVACAGDSAVLITRFLSFISDVIRKISHIYVLKEFFLAVSSVSFTTPQPVNCKWISASTF